MSVNSNFHKSIGLILLLFFVLLTSISAQSKKEKKKARKEKAQQEYLEIKVLIENGAYKINVDRASTPKGRSVQLSGQSYVMTIESGNGNADLPFYGTSQNAGYGSDSGISFDGELMEYTADFKDNKGKGTIKFKVKSTGTEVYRVILSVSGSTASVTVLSNYKSNMNYSGTIRAL